MFQTLFELFRTFSNCVLEIFGHFFEYYSGNNKAPPPGDLGTPGDGIIKVVRVDEVAMRMRTRGRTYTSRTRATVHRTTTPRQALGVQTRALLTLGLPLVGSHLAQMAITTTDTIMLGWYDVTALAGVSLAGPVFFCVFIVGSGFARCDSSFD